MDLPFVHKQVHSEVPGLATWLSQPPNGPTVRHGRCDWGAVSRPVTGGLTGSGGLAVKASGPQHSHNT